MVEPRKAHNERQTPIHLALLASFFLGMLGCSESTPYKVINLHFKSAEQIKSILTHLASNTPEIQFSDKTILIPSDSENVNIILKIIKEIDKPPTSYQLQLSKKNITSRSTGHIKNNILLLEGKETTTQYNNHNIKITILKATADSSLIDLSSIPLKSKKKSYQKNHWLVKHDKRNEIAKDIFPAGFILKVIE